MEPNKEQKEIVEGIQRKIDYLKEWEARAKGVKDLTPVVQNMLESASWEKATLSSLPPTMARLPRDIAAAMHNGLDFITTAFPLPPRYYPDLTSSGNVVSASGTVSLFGYLADIAKSGTPDAIEYSQKYMAQYQEIQQKQHHADEVRGLIEKLESADILKRFDKASTAYLRLKAGTGERTEAGNEMRNLLQGLKGILWNLARKNPREDMTWSIMAERLAKGGAGSIQCSTLKKEEAKYISLQGSLSHVSKDWEGESPIDLDLVWTQLIGHLYVVLGLVKFPTP